MGAGRLLIVLGAILIALGALVSLSDKLPIRFGHLPGDLVIRGKHSVFYFPVVTCLLLSVLLTAILWLVNRR